MFEGSEELVQMAYDLMFNLGGACAFDYTAALRPL